MCVGGSGIFKWDPVEESYVTRSVSLKEILEPGLLPFFFCSLVTTETVVFLLACYHDALLHTGPRTAQPNDPGLKPLKYEPKAMHSSLKLLISGILS